MVSFENFVKSMPPSLSELKVTPSFCFPFKIPDDPTASTVYMAKATSLLLPPYRRGGNSIQVDDDKMASVQFKTFCIFASSIQFLLEPSTKNAKKINNLSKG